MSKDIGPHVAKVRIKASGVGPELEAFIEATWPLDFPALDDFKVHEREEVWVFDGDCSSIRDYDFTLEGLFGFDGRLLDPAARDLREDLYDAIFDREGEIEIVWIETKANSAWSCERVARIAIQPDVDRVAYQSGRVIDWRYWSLDALEELYDCDFREALKKHLSGGALEGFVNGWKKHYPDERLSAHGAETLLKSGLLDGRELRPNLRRDPPLKLVDASQEPERCSVCLRTTAGKEKEGVARPIPLLRFGVTLACRNCLSLNVPEKTFLRLVTDASCHVQ